MVVIVKNQNVLKVIVIVMQQENNVMKIVIVVDVKIIIFKLDIKKI